MCVICITTDLSFYTLPAAFFSFWYLSSFIYFSKRKTSYDVKTAVRTEILSRFYLSYEDRQKTRARQSCNLSLDTNSYQSSVTYMWDWNDEKQNSGWVAAPSVCGIYIILWSYHKLRNKAGIGLGYSCDYVDLVALVRLGVCKTHDDPPSPIFLLLVTSQARVESIFPMLELYVGV
jgi:hypothetical protein